MEANIFAAALQDSGFPFFVDGNVLIILSPSYVYRLHSHTLHLKSSFFRGLLASNASAVTTPIPLESNIAYQFELELPKHDNGAIGELKQRYLNNQGQPVGNPIATSDDNNLSQYLLTAYDNVLRSFYDEPMSLSEDSGLQSVLNDVRVVVQVSESLGSTRSVSAGLNNSLVKYGQTLFQGIADDPFEWAELGVLIHSETIVREATCHLAGQWSCNEELRRRAQAAWGSLDQQNLYASTAKRAELQGKFLSLVKRKASELEAWKKGVETQLTTAYPVVMDWHHATSKAANVSTGSRTTRGSGQPTHVAFHTKHIYDWMALAFFRQWLAQQLSRDQIRLANDGGYSFYNAIYRGGEAYLDQAAREAFTQRFPLSSKSRTSFDFSVGTIKECIKEWVAELVHTSCELITEKYPVPWLTCTAVYKAEMPWMTGEPDMTETVKTRWAQKHQIMKQKWQPSDHSAAVAGTGNPISATTTPASKGTGQASKKPIKRKQPAEVGKNVSTPSSKKSRSSNFGNSSGSKQSTGSKIKTRAAASDALGQGTKVQNTQPKPRTGRKRVTAEMDSSAMKSKPMTTGSDDEDEGEDFHTDDPDQGDQDMWDAFDEYGE